MPTSERFSTIRVPGIDVLRGLCIVAVVVHHINLRLRFQHSHMAELFPALVNALVWNGYYGVRVFFVISGFLITTWSLKRWGRLESMNWRQFYLMRFARIVPCLAALLVLLSILDRSGVPRFTINTAHTSLLRALSAAATFHINWLEARTGYLPANWDVLWSLSVEEVFYLFFPLLCRWSRKPPLLIALLSAFVVIGPLARTVLTRNELWMDYGYLSCMDGIALGCLAAILSSKVSFGIKANLVLRMVGTSLCLLITVFRGTAAALGFYKIGLDVTLLSIGTALLVIAFQQRAERDALKPETDDISWWSWRAPARLLSAALRWFGRNSYEVYLTHMFAIWPMVWAYFHFHQTFAVAPLWFLAITILSGWSGYATARFYSEPLNFFIRKKWPSRKVAAVAQASHG